MKVIVLVWTLLAMMGAAAVAGGRGPAFPESGHIVGHFIIFGGLAWVLDRNATWRPGTILCVVLAAGAGVEVSQAVASGRPSLRESGFDCLVNALAAMTGLALGSRHTSARAIGRWLHPVLLVPWGLTATFYAAERSLEVAFFWAIIATLCLTPSAGIWVEAGWLEAPATSTRAVPPLRVRAAAGAGATLVAALAIGSGAPDGIAAVSLVLALMTAAVTLATTMGLPLSLRVSLALLLAVAIIPWSSRGWVPFVVAALLLSWERLRTRSHPPIAVAGAWALTGALLVPSTLLAAW